MRTSGFDPAFAEILSRRLKIISIFIIVMISVLIFRLWFLQIVNGPVYREKSENNRIKLKRVPPLRGLIFDRNGELLVDNRPSYDLCIIPEDVQDREVLFSNIKRLISLDIKKTGIKLRRSHSRKAFEPVLIKKNITREELAIIETNGFNLPGVDIQRPSQRYYIYGTLASHIIGYLSEISERQLKSGKYSQNIPGDYVGRYGIESIWQNQLNGESGYKQDEEDANGRMLRTISEQPPVPGYNINLTIDKDLQLLAENLLKDKSGAIVALDPKTGEVLAMASGPAFDPNKFVGGINSADWKKYNDRKYAALQNRAIGGQYPPASTFKIIVALAGLEEGIIDPEEKVFCNGSYRLGNHSYGCWGHILGGHGHDDLRQAMIDSCDVYFYEMGKRIGIDVIAKYARMFGLGQKTGIDLDSEINGIIPDREWKLKKFGEPWQQGETISCAIGQSYVTATPIQMACMVSAVFNGGILFQPRVVKSVKSETESVYEFSPNIMKKLNIDSENIEMVKEALVAVVSDPKGSGRPAKVKGVTVAGKTGTAEVVNQERAKSINPDGEVPEQFHEHAWFVAVAPVEDPRIALSVLIEHGKSGRKAAAPVAGELIKQYLKVKSN